MRARISDHDFEILSAYIDGQLSAGEQKRLEAQLKTRPELEQTLEDLRQMRALLRAAPRRRAPRSFTLTQSMLEDARPQRTGLFQSLFPGLSFVSALTALVLVATIFLNLNPGAQMSAAAPEEAAQQAPLTTAADTREMEQSQPEIGAMTAPEQTLAEQAAGTPPNIQWADPTVPQLSKDVGPYAQVPQMAYGRGGAADNPVYGMGGGGGYSVPFVIPLEGVESLVTEPEQQNAQPLVLPESAPEFAGGGPILGIPSTEQQGQVVITSAWGAPLTDTAQQAPLEAPTGADESAPVETRAPATSSLRLLQALLALLTLATGLAAYWMYRESRAR